MKNKFTFFFKTVSQYFLFSFLVLLSISISINNILAGIVLAASSLLILPGVREKYVPQNLRAPRLTAGVIVAAFFITMFWAEQAVVEKQQRNKDEATEAAMAQKEKAVAEFLENPQPKIEEIANLIEQEIYGGARYQLNTYRNVDNAELKALDTKLSKIEEKLEHERRVAAEKAAEERRRSQAAALWSYARAADPMSKGISHTATIRSSNTVNFDFPYEGAQNGRLTLRTDPQYGKDVIFRIEKGQILCSSYESCTVRVRFDDEDAASYTAVGAADNSTETIFLRNYSRFVEKMMKAQRVRISMNVHREGVQVFDFDVSGFNAEQYMPK